MARAGEKAGVWTGQVVWDAQVSAAFFWSAAGVSLTGGFRQRLCGQGGMVTCWRQRRWGWKYTSKHDLLKTVELQGEGARRLGCPLGQDPCAPRSRSENLTGFGLRANLTSFWGPKQVAAESVSGRKALCSEATVSWPGGVVSLSPCGRARLTLGRTDPVDSGRSLLSRPHRELIFLRGLCYLPSPSQPRGQNLGFLVFIFQDRQVSSPVDSAPGTSCIAISVSFLVPAFVPAITCPEVNWPALRALHCSQNILFQA